MCYKVHNALRQTNKMRILILVKRTRCVIKIHRSDKHDKKKIQIFWSHMELFVNFQKVQKLEFQSLEAGDYENHH